MRTVRGLSLACLSLVVLGGTLRASDCISPLATMPASPFEDLWTSPNATGDWFGARSALGESGIGFEADLTQFYFGVVNGGLQRQSRYSGHGDYVINLDGGKLGVQEGMFVKLRAEHRFGQSVNFDTGALMPATLAADLPVADSDHVYLTNVLITQMFSENFGVFAGKMDTLDGDLNAFAHGRGKTQFSNLGFVVNPIALRTVPFATLGTGFVLLHEQEPIFTFSVLNAVDTTRTAGFEELFNDGVVLSAQLRVPVTLFDLPGHQLIAGTWSSRDFVALGQDPRLIIPPVALAKREGSWSAFWNFDQYLWVDPHNEGHGWGVFGRAGVADDRTNPLGWFLSFGVGGNSLLPGREEDTFGAGWYYVGLSDEVGPLLTTALGPLGDGQGVELYYNAVVTEWFHLTPDLQVLVPGRRSVDTDLILGLRGRIIF